MKQYYLLNTILFSIGLMFLATCQWPVHHSFNEVNTKAYTCPMPSDHYFSYNPGKCPKCGMPLIANPDVGNKNNLDSTQQKKLHHTIKYTCPMHPQITSDTAGACPICGMALEIQKPDSLARTVSLNALLKPVNHQVIANVPMIHMMPRMENIELRVYGFVQYNTNYNNSIVTNVSGRIDKLYIQYKYQEIHAGDKIAEIYSPDLLSAQENLLMVLKNDPTNASLINSARQKLLLLGMSQRQLKAVEKSGKAFMHVTIYSQYSGHIHESIQNSELDKNTNSTSLSMSFVTSSLSLKEGMYVAKGTILFYVFNPNKAWAVLNLFDNDVPLVRQGNKVLFYSETNPEKQVLAAIHFIEPYYQNGNKTTTARVVFDNSALNIPIGSQVTATIFTGNKTANWLPKEAVLSLGMDKIVFVRTGEVFVARKVQTGLVYKNLIQIMGGLKANEAVAADAQYLVDSESFIQLKS